MTSTEKYLEALSAGKLLYVYIICLDTPLLSCLKKLVTQTRSRKRDFSSLP